MIKNVVLAKRLCLSSFLGALFGLLCFIGFIYNSETSTDLMQYTQWSFFNPMMWGIIMNRMAIGFVIGLMGFITIHPLFGFRLPSFFRGFMIGAFISLTLALGAMIGNSEAIKTFLILTFAGGIIGLVIDVVVTKVIGEGKILYEENTMKSKKKL